MLEFIVGRRYMFRNDVGQFVGTFDGLSDGQLRFTNVKEFVEIYDHESISFPATAMVDADRWHQDMPLADQTACAMLPRTAKYAQRIASRQIVSVARATPEAIKNW